MAEIFNHGYALLVGVGEYDYSKLSLPVTVKDTQSLYAALIDPELCAYPDNEDHIRVLNDKEATHSAILDGLNWLRTQTEANSESTALVYFSGHGWLEKSNNSNGHYYLLPHDFDPLEVEKTALSSENFTNTLREIRSERLLVILDCCYAAGMTTSKGVETAVPPKLQQDFVEVPPSQSKDLIDALKQGGGRVVFTSSRDEQKSWIKDETNSIYTYHFLEALQGADNKPGDSEVKVSNLMHYLGTAVPESAKKIHDAEQNPWFDMGTEDFVIAKLRGGKGLPEEGWEAAKPEATQKIKQIAQNIYQYGKYITNIEKAERIHIGDIYHK